MIEVQANNQIYDGFTEIVCNKSMDEFCGQFTLTASVQTQVFSEYPLRRGQQIKILVDSTVWMTGRIEVITPSYDRERMVITMSGRDITSDVLDSTVGSNMSLEGPISLKKLIEQSLSLNGITGITVVDKIGTLSDFSSTELIRPDFGANLFQYLESYAQSRQALLITNSQGQIEITRSQDNILNGKLRNKVGTENNIESAKLTVDETDRFYKYNVSSQANFNVLSWEGESIQSATNRLGSATDSAIRTSKVLNIISKQPLNAADCQKRADWEANVRRARSTQYECDLDGHSIEGTVIDINQIHSIDDDFANINSQMILSSVTLSTNSDGNTATLIFKGRDAYTLNPTASPTIKNSSNIGLVWNDDNFQ